MQRKFGRKWVALLRNRSESKRLKTCNRRTVVKKNQLKALQIYLRVNYLKNQIPQNKQNPKTVTF